MAGGLDQASEQRMRPARTGEEFWVVLAGQEVGVTFEFNQFHQTPVRGDAGETGAVPLCVPLVKLHALAQTLCSVHERSKGVDQAIATGSAFLETGATRRALGITQALARAPSDMRRVRC